MASRDTAMEFGVGDLRGWKVERMQGKSEPTLRAFILGAVAASQKWDYDALAKIWAHQVGGKPAWAHLMLYAVAQGAILDGYIHSGPEVTSYVYKDLSDAKGMGKATCEVSPDGSIRRYSWGDDGRQFVAFERAPDIPTVGVVDQWRSMNDWPTWEMPEEPEPDPELFGGEPTEPVPDDGVRTCKGCGEYFDAIKNPPGEEGLCPACAGGAPRPSLKTCPRCEREALLSGELPFCPDCTREVAAHERALDALAHPSNSADRMEQGPDPTPATSPPDGFAPQVDREETCPVCNKPALIRANSKVCEWCVSEAGKKTPADSLPPPAGDATSTALELDCKQHGVPMIECGCKPLSQVMGCDPFDKPMGNAAAVACGICLQAECVCPETISKPGLFEHEPACEKCEKCGKPADDNTSYELVLCNACWRDEDSSATCAGMCARCKVEVVPDYESIGALCQRCTRELEIPIPALSSDAEECPGEPPSDGIERSAVFSDCEVYRYTLERVWDPSLPRILFVLLNPSTADAVNDDPTNRRGIGFAKAWGFGSCIFVNLFAFRSPDPKVMKAADDPVGEKNDAHILDQASRADRVVAAWGTHGNHQLRDSEVLDLLEGVGLYHLGLTKDGHPKHPLYLSKDTELVPWEKNPSCGGIDPDAVCACGDKGIEHDHRTGECARCSKCTGFVAVDTGEPDHNASLLIAHCTRCKREWETPANRTTPDCECGARADKAEVLFRPSPTQEQDEDDAIDPEAEMVCGSGHRKADHVNGDDACGTCGSETWESPVASVPGATEGGNGSCSSAVRFFCFNCAANGMWAPGGEPSDRCSTCGEAKWFITWASGEQQPFRNLPHLLYERGVERIQGDPAICVLCTSMICNGQRVQATPRNREMVAHVDCFAKHWKVWCEGVAPEQAPILGAFGADPRSPCEWNPVDHRVAQKGDHFHGRADLLVGTGDRARKLCYHCAGLQHFNRLRKRIELHRG